MSLLLGGFGVFVPLLPTTPFLLLAAALYLRSSDRMYRFLHGDHVFGTYLRRYRDGTGLSPAYTAWILAVLWGTLGLSAGLMILRGTIWPAFPLAAVGCGVTLHILHIRKGRNQGASAAGSGGSPRDRGSRRAERPGERPGGS